MDVVAAGKAPPPGLSGERCAAIRLLLRPRDGIAGPPGRATARVLARADHSSGNAGWRAQIERAFRTIPRGLPIAALTRQLDCGDAELQSWLRADPAHVRADMATARMLACGDLGLSADETEQLLKPLRPVFGDAGFPISAPLPQRWYLALPKETRLPDFADPHDALGAPLDDYLPAGEPGRRWRYLLNEAQVILHNHPVNAARVAAGKLPVNSLWFWGAGPLPDSLDTRFERVASDDVVLRALAMRAGSTVSVQAGALGEAAAAAVLVDLRDLRDAALLEAQWVAPAVAAGRALELDFGDGAQLAWQPRHRWRLWRRPRTGLA